MNEYIYNNNKLTFTTDRDDLMKILQPRDSYTSFCPPTGQNS